MSPRKPAPRRATGRKSTPRRAAAHQPARTTKTSKTAKTTRPAKAAKASKPPGRPARARRSTAMRAREVASLRFARSILDSLCKGFPEDKLTYQPAMTDNHIIWTLGHLAVTNQWFAGLLDGQPATLPERYEERFGYKSKPNPDRDFYPPLADVLRYHEASFARLVRAAEQLSDDELSAPCAQDSGGFAKDKGEVLERAVWHEGWHAGQISSLRRSLGLSPVMG